MSSPFPGLTLTLHPPVPDPRAAEGFPPHPPLWALCLRQSRREHRAGTRTPPCRPAGRRVARAAGYRARRATRAAVPMPALRRSHDRHRGVRPRLRAELAPDPNKDRHVMSQTSSECRDFPLPLRRRHAGGDLSRPDHRDQCNMRLLTRSERPPKSKFKHPELAPQTSRPHRASLTSTIKLSANIKSP